MDTGGHGVDAAAWRIGMPRDAASLLLVAVLWILYFALQPLLFRFDEALVSANLTRAFQRPVDEGSLIAGLVLLPAGLLMGWAIARDASFRRLATWVTLAACGCAVVELLQAATERRHARPGDFVASVAAIVGGVWLARWVVRTERIHDAVARVLRIGVVSSAVCFLLGSIAAPVIAVRGAVLRGWDNAYHLLIGDEATGNRPWNGRLWQFGIYDSALSQQEAEQLCRAASRSAEGTSLRRQFGAVAYWSCSFPPAAAERVGLDSLIPSAPPIALSQIEPARAQVMPENHTMQRRGPIALRSQTPVPDVSRRISESGAFSVELKLACDELRQSGPARILTISADASHRNLTVGQNGDGLVMRLRTPVMGENGARCAPQWRRFFADRGSKHVVLTYRDGVARLYVDGQPDGRVVAATTLSAVLGIQSEWGALWAALLVFGSLGLLAQASLPQAGLKTRYRTLSSLLTPVPSVAAMWLVALEGDRCFDWSAACLAIICAGAGGVTHRLLIRVCSAQDRFSYSNQTRAR